MATLSTPLMIEDYGQCLGYMLIVCIILGSTNAIRHILTVYDMFMKASSGVLTYIVQTRLLSMPV